MDYRSRWKKPLAFQGAREVDVYAMFFDQEAYDKFKLNKDEFALLKEKEEKDKEACEKRYQSENSSTSQRMGTKFRRT